MGNNGTESHDRQAESSSADSFWGAVPGITRECAPSGPRIARAQEHDRTSSARRTVHSWPERRPSATERYARCHGGPELGEAGAHRHWSSGGWHLVSGGRSPWRDFPFRCSPSPLPFRTPSVWPPVSAAAVGAFCAEGLSERISFWSKLDAVSVVSPGLSITGTFQDQLPAVPVEERRSAPLHAGAWRWCRGCSRRSRRSPTWSSAARSLRAIRSSRPTRRGALPRVPRHAWRGERSGGSCQPRAISFWHKAA